MQFYVKHVFHPKILELSCVSPTCFYHEWSWSLTHEHFVCDDNNRFIKKTSILCPKKTFLWLSLLFLNISPKKQESLSKLINYSFKYDHHNFPKILIPCRVCVCVFRDDIHSLLIREQRREGWRKRLDGNDMFQCMSNMQLSKSIKECCLVLVRDKFEF